MEHVYQINAIEDSNKAQIMCVGYMDTKNEIYDEPIEIENDKLTDCAYVRMYKSRVNHQFILTNKKLPVVRASVLYKKPLVAGSLFDIVLMFNIVSDTSKIKSFEDLLTVKLNGEYVIEIYLNGNVEVLDIEKFTSYDEIKASLYDLLTNEGMVDIINSALIKRNEERSAKMGSNVTYEIPVPKYSLDEFGVHK